MKNYALALLIAVMSLSVACFDGAKGTIKFSSQKGTPIAKVGDVTLTVEGVNQRLNSEAAFVRKLYLENPDKMAAYVDIQIDQFLLAQEAIKQGYLDKPEIQEQIRKLLAKTISTEILTKGRKTPNDIPMQEIEAYYNSHQDEFRHPHLTRVRYVKIDFNNDKKATQKIATEVHKIAQNMTSKKDIKGFKDLVEQYSTEKTDDPSKKGVTDFLDEAALKAQFGDKAQEAIASLEKTGDLSPVIEGENAFYIFQKKSEKVAHDQSLADATPKIRQKLFRLVRIGDQNKIVAELRQKHGVKVYTDKVDQLKINDSDLY